MPPSGRLALLAADLSSSTEFLNRASDESAPRILKADNRLLVDAVVANRGDTVKQLGAGLMAVFPSPAEAVQCAITMQRSAARLAGGTGLSIRIGMHVNGPSGEESDYSEKAFSVAQQLCKNAAPGQILCSALVAGMLAGRQGFTFRSLDSRLSGLATSVPVCEVLYQREDPAATVSRTPFVGRRTELSKLKQKFNDARTGRGGMVMLVGEPGIGKSRVLEEFTEAARADHALVLWGRCYEGEWAPPYNPFAQAIAEYARDAEPEDLRRSLGFGGPPLARLVPLLRERLPDLTQPVPLVPEEERFRVLDAASQLLIAVSQRAPLVVVLDDLHWADKGTLAMLRHVARFIARHSILVLGAYRDVEIDQRHPLTDALAALRRETPYERLQIRGLDPREVGDLLGTIANQDVPETFVNLITTETDGNPFFIRELILHLVEEKKIFPEDGRWTSDLTIEKMGIPEAVRQVIGRRLSRLSEDTNRLLTVASTFDGVFRFDIAAAVAGLDESAALDAVDEALTAQIISPRGDAESFDFVHALFRHTLYSELSPPRQVRMHRRVAEAMERTWGERVTEHAGEVAYHYSRSATLSGARRGAAHAIVGADRAEAGYAHDEVVSYLRIALELLPKSDKRRLRLLARLGLALTWTLQFDEALSVVRQAGELIARSKGRDAAAEYLSQAAAAMEQVGSPRGSWELAKEGLRYCGDRRDLAWAVLTTFDIRREEAEDVDNPGTMLDSPRRRELNSFVNETIREDLRAFNPEVLPGTRAEILASTDDQSARAWATRTGEPERYLVFWAGEFRRGLPLYQERAARSEREGRIGDAVLAWADLARCHNALGNFEDARSAFGKAVALSGRLTGPSQPVIILAAALDEIRLAIDKDWDKTIKATSRLIGERPVENNWAFDAIRATGARAFAHMGMADQAMALLGTLLAPLKRAPGWAHNYVRLAADVASTLWLLGRTDYIDVIERNVRDKVIAPDFRCPMFDGRLSLARLCALQQRHDEAAELFAEARGVLEQQGARPLRALTDFDEGLMYLRRAAAGDRERAQPMLAAAIEQFHAVGMTGWLQRASLLLERGPSADLQYASAITEPARNSPAREADREAGSEHYTLWPAPPGPSARVDISDRDSSHSSAILAIQFRKEGDYWTIGSGSKVFRLKDVKGLHWIHRLLRHPEVEVHSLDLIAGTELAEPEGPSAERSRAAIRAMTEAQLASVGLRQGAPDDAGEMLDAEAKARYQRRLAELREELEEVKELGNVERGCEIEQEIRALARELSRAVGLAGRDRRAASVSERARQNVSRAIKAAVEKVTKNDAELGLLLARRIKTGTFCSYLPVPSDRVSWEL
jgi:class 3 adenylate cyclase/tetratricopeptide (TPR) repeat protein